MVHADEAPLLQQPSGTSIELASRNVVELHADEAPVLQQPSGTSIELASRLGKLTAVIGGLIILVYAGFLTCSKFYDTSAVHLARELAIPSTMRFVYRDASGDCAPPSFNCISVKRGPLPPLRADSVMIRVVGSSINHDDNSNEKIYADSYRNIVLGFDVSGIVVAVGGQCSKFQLGDRVWSSIPIISSQFHGSGGLAEYAVVVCAYTSFAPSSVDLAQAGTLPTDAITSLGVFEAAGAPWKRDNFTVLICAGTGGTGYPGVQMAKALGATTVVTAAGHADGVAFVKSLGADIAVDYHTSSVFDAVPDGSVDLIYDNLGIDPGPVFKKLKSQSGKFISIVNDSTPHDLPHGVSQSFYFLWSDDQLPTLPHKLDTLSRFIADGSVKLFAEQTYDFDHIKEAYARLVIQGNLKTRISIIPEKKSVT